MKSIVSSAHPAFGAEFLSQTPVRLRPDLQIATIQRGVDVKYVVKDPVGLRYFEFDEHEIALLRKLDGRTGWDELRRWFNRRFPPLRLSHRALQSLIWRLYQQGLLTAVASGQGGRVAERAGRQARQDWLQVLLQPWVVRLPGFDPGACVTIVSILFGWIFSPWFVGLAIPVMLTVAALAVSQRDALLAMGPSSTEFLSQGNLALLAAVIVVTKVCHELGHAVAARRFGSDCHEMGVLLLAGLPSLYCDVSDAWMLPRRWQRIAISLAGIWVEMLIATTAFVVWSASVPGFVHACSFNIMVACSLGTLFFNANPLVKYDGYYVLMDLTNVSNLGQRANGALMRCLTRWVLGSREERPLDEPELPAWCLVYAAASAVYRVFLTCAILWGLHWALKPYSASALIWITAAVAATTWGFKMLQTSSQHVRRAAVMGTPKWRIAGGLIVTTGLLAAAMFIPLPWFVFGDALLEPADRQTLTAVVAGKLRDRPEPGTNIEPATGLVRLENRDLQREILQLEAETRAQSRHLESLMVRRNEDRRAGEQIPGAQAALAAVEHRLAYLHEEAERLELQSTIPGRVYPVAERWEPPREDELPRWIGSLLDPLNRDAWVAENEAVCQVGSPDQLEAIAVLAQDDLEAVKVGQPADVFLRSSGRSVRGEVARISRLEIDPRDDATVSRLLPRTLQRGDRRPSVSKWYQVQIRCLEACPEGTVVRTGAKIRIRIGTRTVGEWLSLQFHKTFRWRA